MSNDEKQPTTPTTSTTDEDKAAKKKAKKQAKAEKATAKQTKQNNLEKSQTVKFSLMQTNGTPVYLCEDGEFRTDEDMAKLGVEE